MGGKGIVVTGDLPKHWNTHNIESSNNVNGKDVIYLKNQVGGTISPDAGQIILANCTDIIIEDQSLQSSSIGIELGFSSNIQIVNSSAGYNKFYGVYLYNSSHVNITGSHIDSNRHYGIYNYKSHGNHIIDNDMNGNRKSGIYSFKSNGIHIIDNYIVGGNTCIYLISANENKVTNNTAWGGSGLSSSVYRGIAMSGSGNEIIGNDVSHNKDYGIVIGGTNNTVEANNASGVVCGYGIYANGARWNTIARNTISDNKKGIYLSNSHWNNITCNTISSNMEYGFASYYSKGNNITCNNISRNDQGLILSESSNNSLYHNNIADNSIQASDDRDDNLWNDSYPSGGNYWSDYDGEDRFRGPDQDIPGPDGIGDTNYTIDADSVDNYPLLGPYPYFPADNYIVLYPGMNLVSRSNTQSNGTVKEVLQSLGSKYDSVQWFDASTKEDPWKHYHILKPARFNDMPIVENTMGIWVNIRASVNAYMAYEGHEPQKIQSIPLNSGWNMVGYPSLSNKYRPDALNNLVFGTEVDAVWTYNASAQKWEEVGDLNYFVVGKGYWIHATQDCVWEVIP